MGPGQQTIALDYFEWGGEALGCRLNGQKQIVLFKPCKLTKSCLKKVFQPQFFTNTQYLLTIKLTIVTTAMVTNQTGR